MNKFYKKIKSIVSILLRVIRYFYRHAVTRPMYLYNYMRHYFELDYIEKINFYDNRKLIELLKTKSLIRIGDGEVHMHNGGSVLGYQTYNKRLSNFLRSIIKNYNDNSPYIIGIPQFTHQTNTVLRGKNLINCWMPLKATIKTYFNKEANYADAHAFYREGGFDNLLRPIIESHKIIMIAGEHNIKLLESENVKIYDKLNIEFIEAPSENAFDQFDEILITVNDKLASIGLQVDKFNKQYRILVSMGPAAKALVYELTKQGYICYDIGKGVETMYQDNKVKDMIG